MKQNKRLMLLLVTVLLGLAACKSQQPFPGTEVTRVTRPAVPSGHAGFFYFLPRTLITIDVQVVKNLHEPGPFAAYAERYLGLHQVIRQPETEYALANMRIRSLSEPDPEQFFFVEPGMMDQQAAPFYLRLSESGLILGVNAGLYSSPTHAHADESKVYKHQGPEVAFSPLIDFNLQEQIDTLIEYVFVDTTTVERQRLRRRWVEKPGDVRARELAERIIDLREKKMELITGFAEIPYSREALEYMHVQMRNKEEEYLALFAGMSSSTVISYRFSFIPDPESVAEAQTLFYFSKSGGLTHEPEPGSQAVRFQITRNQTTQAIASFTEQSVQVAGKPSGFYYRIPELSTLTVKKAENTLAEARILINQYGVVTALPYPFTEIEFYPGTGALKSVGTTRRDAGTHGQNDKK